MEIARKKSSDGRQSQSSESDFHSVESVSDAASTRYKSFDVSPKNTSSQRHDKISHKISHESKKISSENKEISTFSTFEYTSCESTEGWKSEKPHPKDLTASDSTKNSPAILKPIAKLKFSNTFSSSGDNRKNSSANQTQKESKQYLDNIPIYEPCFVLSPQLYLTSGLIGILNVFIGYLEIMFKDIAELLDKHFDVDGNPTMNLNWIVAFTSLLLSGYVADKIGRKYLLVACAVLSIASCVGGSYTESYTYFVVFLVLYGILFGFIFSTTVIYITECSFPESRGLTVAFLTVSYTVGDIVGRVTKLLFEDQHDEIKLRFYHGIPGLVSMIFLCFVNIVPRSPRFCAMRFDFKSARTSLNVLRFHKEKCQREMKMMKYTYSINRPKFQRNIFKSMFYTPHVRKALITGFGFVVGVVICSRIVPGYVRQILSLPGKEFLLVELIRSILACVSACFSCFLVDRFGRKNCFYLGFSGQFLSLIMLSITTYQLQKFSPPASPIFTEYRDECNIYTNCWDCINSKTDCTFCYNRIDDIVTGGSCVKTREDNLDEISQCSLNSTNGVVKFSNEHCPKAHRLVPVLGFISFTIFQNIGIRAALFTWITEIPPQWCRGQFTSLMHATLVLNLFLDYSKFIDNLALLFILIAGCNVLIIGFVYVFIPETKCRPLEYTDLLFMPKATRRKMAATINEHVNAHL